MYNSACLRSSPIIKTVEVVPSPVSSFCAVDALAISEAVGCWICYKNLYEAKYTSYSKRAYHFVKQHISVLCDLDVSCTRNQPTSDFKLVSLFTKLGSMQMVLNRICRTIQNIMITMRTTCFVRLQLRTYIFIVPLGPRLVLSTSCRPLAPLILMARACEWRAVSAFEFTDLIAAMTVMF